MNQSARQLLQIFLTTFVLLLLLEVAGRSLFFFRTAPESSGILYLSKLVKTYWQNKALLTPKAENKLDGKALNRLAWNATFEERGLTPRFGEPREGYWGEHVLPHQQERFLRYVERPIDIPDRVYVDPQGFQYAAASGHEPEYTILILGGSVAYGAYASEYATTYFARLVDLLARENIFVEIYILAAGGWVSNDELIALVLRGLDKSPDMVMFFDGLNDLTNIDRQYAKRTSDYLNNMKKAKAIIAAKNISVVFALQPFLPGKKLLTPIEKQIMKLTQSVNALPPFYEKMVLGLRDLDDGRQAFFVDCSHLFDNEKQTTFTDVWHFTDPGHQIVAAHLAAHLADIITAENR